jgi:hypothetical protein
VTIFGAASNVVLRPVDGVEGELLFEASRIRSGLGLYTDPVVGALDYGSVPARYFVLYPPLWAGFLSLWPKAAALIVGRLASMFAWWGTLAVLPLSARPRCRLPACLAALFVGGVYSLAEFGGSARPDSVALAIAALAMARAVRKGEADALSGGLFALAFWIKPNVIGMAGGAMLACFVVSPRAALRAALGGVVLTAAVVIALERVSSGTWIHHLLASMGQPLHLHLFAHHLEARAQFFVFFLTVAGFFAWKGARAPAHRASSEAKILLLGLAVSVAWSFVTFAKVGSAANYWMEPCVAAVILFSRIPPPDLSPRGRSTLAIALPLQALWTGVGSMRATFESIDENRTHALLLDHARTDCGVGRESLVVADEPGVEMTLDGRLVAHPFVLTSLALRGLYPLEPWIADLRRPEIGCVVTMHDRIERPPGEVDVDYDYFAVPVRTALSARFTPVAGAAGWEVYARR